MGPSNSSYLLTKQPFFTSMTIGERVNLIKHIFLKSPFSIGNTSSNCTFSIAMLVYRSVI